MRPSNGLFALQREDLGLVLRAADSGGSRQPVIAWSQPGAGRDWQEVVLNQRDPQREWRPEPGVARESSDGGIG